MASFVKFDIELTTINSAVAKKKGYHIFTVKGNEHPVDVLRRICGYGPWHSCQKPHVLLTEDGRLLGIINGDEPLECTFTLRGLRTAINFVKQEKAQQEQANAAPPAPAAPPPWEGLPVKPAQARRKHPEGRGYDGPTALRSGYKPIRGQTGRRGSAL